MTKQNFDAEKRKIIPPDEFTFFKDVGVYVCNNCGAYSHSIETVEHFKNCNAGENKYWQEFYTRANYEEQGEIENPLKFILAGKAIFTIVSKKTNKRFTYLIKKKRGKSKKGDLIWFVRVLTGQSNISDYEYMGTIFGDTLTYVPGRKSRIGTKAPCNKAFIWFYKMLQKKKNISNQCGIYHEGFCGRCGRRLTVPESIKSGFGPECIGKV